MRYYYLFLSIVLINFSGCTIKQDILLKKFENSRPQVSFDLVNDQNIVCEIDRILIGNVVVIKNHTKQEILDTIFDLATLIISDDYFTEVKKEELLKGIHQKMPYSMTYLDDDKTIIKHILQEKKSRQNGEINYYKCDTPNPNQFIFHRQIHSGVELTPHHYLNLWSRVCLDSLISATEGYDYYTVGFLTNEESIRKTPYTKYEFKGSLNFVLTISTIAYGNYENRRYLIQLPAAFEYYSVGKEKLVYSSSQTNDVPIEENWEDLINKYDDTIMNY
ncbi:MAG: hypothetical protein AB8G11_22590 [Saprospiraceae bacterium]